MVKKKIFQKYETKTKIEQKKPVEKLFHVGKKNIEKIATKFT